MFHHCIKVERRGISGGTNGGMSKNHPRFQLLERHVNVETYRFPMSSFTSNWKTFLVIRQINHTFLMHLLSTSIYPFLSHFLFKYLRTPFDYENSFIDIYSCSSPFTVIFASCLFKLSAYLLFRMMRNKMIENGK